MGERLSLSRILLEALDSPLRRWAGLPVTGYTVSRYTIVVLSHYWCGIAYTVPGARPAATLPLEVSTRLLARNADLGPVERSLAIAAVNAATTAWLYYTLEPPVHVEPCLLDLAGIGPGDVLVLAGFMEPLARRARERGARVIVFENDSVLKARAEREGYQVAQGEKEKARALGKATHFFMSGSGLVEDPARALEELRAAREAVKALVGPTASFHPLIGERLGVDIVAGSSVMPGGCGEAWRLIASGHGAHSLSKRIRVVKWAAVVGRLKL